MALRFGLIGCGPMGRRLAEELIKLPDACLVAVADPADEARAAAVEAYQAEAYAEPECLLAREEVDAVIVATPSYLHAPLTIAAAQAGKHVFCEKPMALTLGDCDRMIAAAEAAGVKLMVGQVLRLMFPWWRIKELASEGQLGAPVCADVTRVFRLGGRGWRARRDQSGGPLFEVNVHELDFLRHLCGEVAQVSTYGGRFLCENVDYPDAYHINLRFRSGAIAHLQGGCASHASHFAGLVICPGGTLTFGPGWGAAALHRPAADPEPLAAPEDGAPRGLAWELSSFVSWVLRGEPPVVTAHDGRAAVELAVAAYRSMESGQPVDLPLAAGSR